jgi:nucleoside triphosphate pyrophosphatase
VLPLYLASASPRRRELLESLGLVFRIEPAQIDEGALPGEAARDHVVRLAALKAATVAAALRDRGVEALVLAADTTVTIDGAILGKPRNVDDALSMLRRLAGRRHDVITACRLARIDDGRTAATVAISSVRFNPWSDTLARWYVATGEPFDKAGAYGIQGRGVLLASRIEGSWSNVVGLPLESLPGLFHDVGDDLFARVDDRKSG